MALGERFPTNFLQLLSREIVNQQIHLLYPTTILEIIRHFISSENQQMVINNIVLLVEIILKSLDPNNIQLRKVCHKYATNALYTLFKSFKCVSFHQKIQKFAFPNPIDNTIQIYDLRTAVKWKHLSGHSHPIYLLKFSPSGKYLASLSLPEHLLNIWKTGTSGFIGTIFGVTTKCYKSIKLPLELYMKKNENCEVEAEWSQNERNMHVCVGKNGIVLNYEIF